MTDWSPQEYLKFADERARPCWDLLQAIGEGHRPRHVCFDVGCGPGNSTEALGHQFPSATLITGIDSSSAMLEAARVRLPDEKRFQFLHADARTWLPPPHTDLVLANATYQWVPSHLDQFERIMERLQPGAALAVQMPDNTTEPSHVVMEEVSRSGPWSDRLSMAARSPLASAHEYHRVLSPLCARLDIWRTVYHHHLQNHSDIVELYRTTGLKPFLDPLSASEQELFLEKYTDEIAKAYPASAIGGVLLPFPRLFLVAHR